MGWTMGLEPAGSHRPARRSTAFESCERPGHNDRKSIPVVAGKERLVRIRGKNGVDDGTRTHDDRDHNPGLYQLSYAHHRGKTSYYDCRFAPYRGAPGRTRTCNRRLRRPMLYPVELRAQNPPVQLTRSWSGQTDSNRRPSAPKADALPDCAMPRDRAPAGALPAGAR